MFDHWGALAEDGATRRLAAQALDQVTGSLARSGVTVVVLEEERQGGWLEWLTGDPDAGGIGAARGGAVGT